MALIEKQKKIVKCGASGTARSETCLQAIIEAFLNLFANEFPNDVNDWSDNITNAIINQGKTQYGIDGYDCNQENILIDEIHLDEYYGIKIWFSSINIEVIESPKMNDDNF